MPSWKMFSADDHVDLQYLPGDMWVKEGPSEIPGQGSPADRDEGRVALRSGWQNLR